MLSTFLLGVLSFLQKIQFKYIYIAIISYLVLLWIFFAVWVWQDSSERFSNGVIRFLVWLPVSLTFVLGFLLYVLVRPAKKDVYWTELEKRYLTYETYGMGKCHVCGFDLRPEYLQCPECADIIRVHCSNCDRVIEKDWKVCPYCGDNKTKEPEVIEKKQRLGMQWYKAFWNGVRAVTTDVQTLTTTVKTKMNNVKKPQLKEPSFWQQLKTLLFVEEKSSQKK
jgi:hypothetical protein